MSKTTIVVSVMLVWMTAIDFPSGDHVGKP